MNRILACVAVCLGSAIVANAQFEKYNPYAQPEALEAAVTPDGKVNWPTFFRSAALKTKFDGYFKIGACRGTNPAINARLQNNEVDINELPKLTVEGVALGTQAGSIQVRDRSGSLFALVTHPAGVSQVCITGTMPVSHLKRGLIVRFEASVNEHGIATEPLSAMDVLSAGVEFTPKPVESGRTQTVIGTISRILNSDRMQIAVVPGKLHRVTLVLKSDITISVNACQPELVAAGDLIKAEGHVYAPPGNSVSTTIFTDKLEVTKRDPRLIKNHGDLAAATTK